MRRWGVGAAAGTLAGMLACTEPAVFACGGDSDCVLGGDQGQCQDNGSCAYPDDDCTSGLSYPEGAPPELAGRCVPDDGSTSTGSDGTEASTSETSTSEASSSDAGGSAGESTSGADEGSSSDPGSSGAAESSSSDGMGTESSGGAVCNGDEVGGTPDDALALGMCSGKFSGMLQDAMDTDWFSIGECSGGLASFDVSVDDPDSSVVCLVPLCEQGDFPSLDCGDAIELPDMNGQVQGCCGASAFEASYDCQGQPVSVYVVAASASTEAPECTGYAFTVLAE